MFYQEYRPCAALADFVKCFWIMEAPQNPFQAKEILIPDGCIELIFNLGTPYKRFKSENDFALLKNSHLVGERDRFFLIEQTRAVHLIAVRFKPGGLYPFVCFPVAEATNQTIDLDLEQISRQAFFSPYHFLRLFRQAFHQTPHQYLTEKRLEKAKHLLVASDLSVTEICFEVGFESLGSFCSLFHRYTGHPPKLYRTRTLGRLQIAVLWPELPIPACYIFRFGPQKSTPVI